jgi:cell division transport system ATP-binding protein
MTNKINQQASSQSTNLIEMQKLTLSFGQKKPLFDEMNLNIKEGSFQFLMGPSGAGKSTLLKMLYLDQLPDKGTLRAFGMNVSNLSMDQRALLRRKIGVVFQDFRLIENLTVLENVSLPLKVQGIHNKQREEEAMELLEWVGLKDKFHSYPAQMSGGQQQRVAIARAVIARPKLLLADEPTGNVDDDVAMRLIYLFEQLHKSGATIVVATHNHALSSAFPYDEMMIHEGKIKVLQKNEGG